MAEKWYCFKDKVPMEEKPVVLFYLNITEAVDGLKCPKCGIIYMGEEIVVEKIIKGEQMLESK